MHEPRIDQNLCMMCEKCVDECPVFIIENDEITIDENEYCSNCGICVEICSAGAIASTTRKKPILHPRK